MEKLSAQVRQDRSQITVCYEICHNKIARLFDPSLYQKS